MFQYTGTYILNSNLDSSGKPKWTSQQEDTMQDPVVKGSFNVKRVNKFIKDNVVSIFKREGLLHKGGSNNGKKYEGI